VTHSHDAQHGSEKQQNEISEHTGVGSETALQALIRRRRLNLNLQPHLDSDGAQQHSAQGASAAEGRERPHGAAGGAES
jgi:hypothetical protein